jgi:hypothetical protein
MATITSTTLIDDLDGSAAEVTVSIRVESQRYSVDLSRANYEEYIAPLIGVARNERRGRPQKSGRRGVKKATSTNGSSSYYSKLSTSDREAVREFLGRSRGRIYDAEVVNWKKAKGR